MKLSLVVTSICVLCLGCSKKTVSSPYKKDVDRLCNVVKYANAEELNSIDKVIVVAQYLGSNLESEEGRALSIKMSQSSVSERAVILRKAAKEAGLVDCHFAKELESSASTAQNQ